MFRIVNKEFLIFLAFVCVSGIFWLMMALNETYEKEFQIPVRLANVPKNAIITTPMDDTLRVTIKDKGYTLVAYIFSHRLKEMKFNFETYAGKKSFSGNIPLSDIQRLLYAQLYSSSRISQVKPDKLTFYYNYGNRKIVPVKIAGSVLAAKNYYISRMFANPSRIVIYASDQLLDSIKEVSTESLHITNIGDTANVIVSLAPIKGVKMVPTKVRLFIYPDVLTEERIEVPITAVNMPEGKVLRTFPQRVNVSFVVGASQYRLIKPEMFKVEADYNQFSVNPSDKCEIRLTTVPRYVSNARLETDKVDYLIEQQ